jgi:hypothetical protein
MLVFRKLLLMLSYTSKPIIVRVYENYVAVHEISASAVSDYSHVGFRVQNATRLRGIK